MDGDFIKDAIAMFGTLILIIGLMIGLLLLLRRLRFRTTTSHNYPLIRLINTLHLSPKASIVLVEIAGKWLVLGVGTERVSLLTEIEATPEFERQIAASQPARRSILDLLRIRSVKNPKITKE